MSSESRVIAVLMAGGEGRRLRPLTGPARSKPCLRVADSRSLMERAFERALALAGDSSRVWALASASSRRNLFCAEGLLDAQAFVTEPSERNTAAAVALACAAAEARAGRNVVMAFMPCDHAFEDPAPFASALRMAAEEACRFDGLLLLGTPPREADPNYGYIRPEGGGDVRDVAGFVEKPPFRQAERCLREGWLWNLGVFVFRLEAGLAALERCAPFYLEAARDVLPGRTSAYLELAPEPFDRLVVEQSPCRAVSVPAEAGWYDLGTWASMRQFLERRTGRRFVTDDEAAAYLLDSNPGSA